MKKKFIRVMFFGALALTTFSYVGCKDYDDDIDRLEQKITENANAIAEINKLIEGGSVITKVENITGGVEVTLSNGKSFTIKNGDAGKEARAGPGHGRAARALYAGDASGASRTRVRASFSQRSSSRGRACRGIFMADGAKREYCYRKSVKIDVPCKMNCKKRF